MRRSVVRVILCAVLLLLAAACTTAPKKDLALEQVRAQLEELKADPELAGYAPLALGEAERALRQAEAATGDTQRIHLIYMADRRIQIARAVAQGEQLEQEALRLDQERNQMLVKASKLEAERARLEAERARMMSEAQAEDARRARDEVLEALSVIVQVGSFKLRGRRVFRMSPLHHHFELVGWSETKVVIRFWIIAIIFALLALAMLKLR